MSKARTKKVIITEEISFTAAEELFGEFATVDAKINQITAKMDAEITKIREKHQAKLAELCEQKDQVFDKLQHFALNSPDSFTKKKSLEFTHGTLGFRTSNPALKTLKGHTWASVTTLLKEFLPDYVRTVEEPAKDKLLADRENEDVQPLLDKVGILVVQSETFYVEPKKETAGVLV